VCRKYRNSDVTFYRWRSRYGGMDISDARKLKAIEDENRRLKRLLPPPAAVRLVKALGGTLDARMRSPWASEPPVGQVRVPLAISLSCC